ncbi:GNAT family N-acetyltransferase [Nisaea acidiphila]|uniref:GNAT family N-acetyltransferase n=1 Tax=Nisaea acidiphila TaxID=1862145 RepID=A0A9J7AUW6_9PROT|nr:GNAT family N-acetyltransferase [Nisaea acidiphila]UUX51119.1 GNAT family N-acetyltransferase [Nisaea acidiphila]
MTGSGEVTYRTLVPTDFDDALALYRELSGARPVAEGALGQERFAAILTQPGSAIHGAEVGGRMVSMATVHVMPNMTYGGRPYALVENVVTLKAFQGRGLGRGVMQSLIDTAWAAGAYKIMLLTGRRAKARGFYEKLGFNGDEKHGMILRR